MATEFIFVGRFSGRGFESIAITVVLSCQIHFAKFSISNDLRICTNQNCQSVLFVLIYTPHKYDFNQRLHCQLQKVC